MIEGVTLGRAGAYGGRGRLGPAEEPNMKPWKTWKTFALLLALVAVPSVAYAATDGLGEGCPCPCCD